MTRTHVFHITLNVKWNPSFNKANFPVYSLPCIKVLNRANLRQCSFISKCAFSEFALWKTTVTGCLCKISICPEVYYGKQISTRPPQPPRLTTNSDVYNYGYNFQIKEHWKSKVYIGERRGTTLCRPLVLGLLYFNSNRINVFSGYLFMHRLMARQQTVINISWRARTRLNGDYYWNLLANLQIVIQ